jgi:hypothetical protein
MRFCWHLTKSATHPTRSAGHLKWRRGCLTNWRVCLSKWRGCLLKSRRHPANWRGHLWAVCGDLTPVGGHLSPVDAASTSVVVASTVVATASPNADTPSSSVEAAWLKVDVSPAAAAFASSAVGIAPVVAGTRQACGRGRCCPRRGWRSGAVRGRAGFRLSAKQIFGKGFTPLPSQPCAAMMGMFATVPSAVNMISPTRHYDHRP